VSNSDFTLAVPEMPTRRALVDGRWVRSQWTVEQLQSNAQPHVLAALARRRAGITTPKQHTVLDEVQARMLQTFGQEVRSDEQHEQMRADGQGLERGARALICRTVGGTGQALALLDELPEAEWLKVAGNPERSAAIVEHAANVLRAWKKRNDAIDNARKAQGQGATATQLAVQMRANAQVLGHAEERIDAARKQVAELEALPKGSRQPGKLRAARAELAEAAADAARAQRLVEQAQRAVKAEGVDPEGMSAQQLADALTLVAQRADEEQAAAQSASTYALTEVGLARNAAMADSAGVVALSLVDEITRGPAAAGLRRVDTGDAFAGLAAEWGAEFSTKSSGISGATEYVHRGRWVVEDSAPVNDGARDFAEAVRVDADVQTIADNYGARVGSMPLAAWTAGAALTPLTSRRGGREPVAVQVLVDVSGSTESDGLNKHIGRAASQLVRALRDAGHKAAIDGWGSHGMDADVDHAGRYIPVLGWDDDLHGDTFASDPRSGTELGTSAAPRMGFLQSTAPVGMRQLVVVITDGQTSPEDRREFLRAAHAPCVYIVATAESATVPQAPSKSEGWALLLTTRMAEIVERITGDEMRALVLEQAG